MVDLDNVSERLRSDEGVSPVIAVILMVAITVVLAATVYVWVSGFASDDTGPEQAAATAKGVDLDDDGDVEWIRVTLTSGENAPYDFEDVTNSTTANNGTQIGETCMDAQGATWSGGNISCDGTEFSGGDSWDVGDNLWMPCLGDGTHLTTWSVRDSTILDGSVDCDADATS
jgi:flagellin-like protein